MKFRSRNGRKAARKHRYFLVLMCSVKGCTFKKLINSAELEEINAISECAYNILKGNSRLKKCDKDFMRGIINPNITMEKCKEILVQKGGSLSKILPWAIRRFVPNGPELLNVARRLKHSHFVKQFAHAYAPVFHNPLYK